jgi:hypothetical protein
MLIGTSQNSFDGTKQKHGNPIENDWLQLRHSGERKPLQSHISSHQICHTLSAAFHAEIECFSANARKAD